VSIPIVNDTLVEGSETVTLALSNALGAALGSERTSVTLTITSDDLGGQIQFSGTSYSVSEAAPTATITLVRSGGLGGPVTVNFATIAGGTATAGVDYTVVPPTPVTFAAGVTSRTVTVPILADALDEPNETVILRLTGPTGATLGPRSTAVLTIVDND
jgi:Calx-beta domain